jgi:hypothetical protein
MDCSRLIDFFLNSKTSPILPVYITLLSYVFTTARRNMPLLRLCGRFDWLYDEINLKRPYYYPLLFYKVFTFCLFSFFHLSKCLNVSFVAFFFYHSYAYRLLLIESLIIIRTWLDCVFFDSLTTCTCWSVVFFSFLFHRTVSYSCDIEISTNSTVELC